MMAHTSFSIPSQKVYHLLAHAQLSLPELDHYRTFHLQKGLLLQKICAKNHIRSQTSPIFM